MKNMTDERNPKRLKGSSLALLPELNNVTERSYEQIAEFAPATATFTLCKSVKMSNDSRARCMHASLLNGLNQALNGGQIKPNENLMIIPTVHGDIDMRDKEDYLATEDDIF